MYVNAQNEIIPEGKSFKVGDISYPRNFPKSEIAGLTEVTLTDKPTDKVVTGFTVVDGVQVWQSRDYTTEEVAAQKENAKIKIDRLAEAERLKYITDGSGPRS